MNTYSVMFIFLMINFEVLSSYIKGKVEYENITIGRTEVFPSLSVKVSDIETLKFAIWQVGSVLKMCASLFLRCCERAGRHPRTQPYLGYWSIVLQTSRPRISSTIRAELLENFWSFLTVLRNPYYLSRPYQDIFIPNRVAFNLEIFYEH